MAVTQQQLETKTKSLKNVHIRVLKTDGNGKVEAFVAVYGKVGIGNHFSAGLMEVNQLWDQSGPKRPKGYIVAGDLFDNEHANTGASVMISEEYFERVSKEERNIDMEAWKAKITEIFGL